MKLQTHRLKLLTLSPMFLLPPSSLPHPATDPEALQMLLVGMLCLFLVSFPSQTKAVGHALLQSMWWSWWLVLV